MDKVTGWLVPGILLFFWVAWWLWAVNWAVMGARLREGAWLPFVLLLILVALVWSQLAPSDYSSLGFVTVPNFWWQLGALGLLAGVAFFCGWLQGYWGLTPAEIDLEPPAHGHAHGHDHGHEPGYELTHGDGHHHRHEHH